MVESNRYKAVLRRENIFIYYSTEIPKSRICLFFLNIVKNTNEIILSTFSPTLAKIPPFSCEKKLEKKAKLRYRLFQIYISQE